ncbi:dynactin subunit 2 [Ischnura elegans]|uniref:dynactin subunit 2 n=1 Tax=Ischnura elegans TaxID=197161 RepID=UPI001ED8B3D0|nr:dynactin subunit 2 [Ischnura elegans]
MNVDMADPKYADLPGIAYDQPDVYETSDLPEADQNIEYVEEETEGIERLHISANEAFNNFKGKSLYASGVDFSDKISRYIRTGYDARSTELELAGEGEKETVVQKYRRLKCEVKELLDEIEEVKSSGEGPEAAASVVALAKEGDRLRKQLDELRLEEIFGEHASELTDPQEAQLKMLLAQLEAFKKGAVTEAQSGTKASAKKDAGGEKLLASYELYSHPEREHFTRNERIAMLEQRLHNLEAFVGPNPEKLSRLYADSGSLRGGASGVGLVGAVESLGARTSLFDPGQLDHIEGRLIALGEKMSSIAGERNKAEGQINPEQEAKVSALYELAKKSEAMTPMLEEVVERMGALNTVHEQALQFSTTLAKLDSLQEKILAGIANNETVLKEVKESFSQNLETIKNNMSSLDARITALKK